MGMDKVIEKKKWPAKRIIKYAAIAIFILLVVYLLLFQVGRSTLNVQREHLTISSVYRGPFQEYIPVTGEIYPLTTIFLGAEEGGIVERVFIEAGTPVKKGDPILKLSNTQLLMNIMWREAELSQEINNSRNTRLAFEQNRLALNKEMAEIDTQLLILKRKFDRYDVLYADKLISRQEYEDTRDDYNLWVQKKKLTLESQEKALNYQQQQIVQLDETVRRMQENLDIARQKLDNLTIRAPISGMLTSLNAEPGQSKSPADRLGQIDALDGFKVRAGIDEYYIDRVKKGQKGSFEFSGGVYPLTTSRVVPEVKEGKFQVDMQFDGVQPQGLRRGQTLRIQLVLSDMSEALLLPRGGFFQKTGGNWVYLLEPDGKTALKRDVRLGRQNPDVYEVLEGLKIGDRVITSSYDTYGDNERLVLK